MKRAVIFGWIGLVVILAVLMQFIPHGLGHANELGEDVLLAARQRDWVRVKTLLDEGADPNVTQIDASRLVPPHRSLIMWFLTPRPTTSHAGGKVQFPSALEQAIEQDNMSAVQLMLSHHAAHDQRDVWAARISGDRALITLMEDTCQIPPGLRKIAQVPFAPGAETATPRVLSASAGAFPMRHLLWLSPDELLLVRKDPLAFSSIDVRTGAVTDLPELTHKWGDQPLFDPDMLALSPDAKWLVGATGYADKPLWLATEINGNGLQQWDRAVDTGQHVVERYPLIAWRDATHWVEINRSPEHWRIMRVYTLGDPAVPELPFARPSYNFATSYPGAYFTFSDPDHAFICGPVFPAAQTRPNPQLKTFMIGLAAGPTDWQSENRQLLIPAEKLPGTFELCVPTPDGQRLAWLNFFPQSQAVDFLLSDANGGNFRIVYEHLRSFRDWKTSEAEAPWSQELEWNPRGDALLFWRGHKGENGLGFLPVAAGE